MQAAVAKGKQKVEGKNIICVSVLGWGFLVSHQQWAEHRINSGQFVMCPPGKLDPDAVVKMVSCKRSGKRKVGDVR